MSQDAKEIPGEDTKQIIRYHVSFLNTFISMYCRLSITMFRMILRLRKFCSAVCFL